MLTDVELETAQSLLIQHTRPLASESVPLKRALGRINALDIRAPHALPFYPQAAMDGFALHPLDLGATRPVRILKYLNPGEAADFVLQPGETVGVGTGSALPRDTGAVVPHEQVIVAGDHIRLQKTVKPGGNIRLPGEDFQENELLVAPGKRVTAGLIAAMAACGMNEILAYRKPRVAILSLDPHHAHNQLETVNRHPDSNGPLLAALVARDGGRVKWIGVRNDEIPGIIRRVFHGIDMLLTIGGTYSRGESEAASFLRDIGADILFQGTRIQPGGHNGAGIRNSQVIISLSGNPAACAVGYELLAAPVMRRFQGLDPGLFRIFASLTNTSTFTSHGTTRFLRGRAACGQNGWTVEALPGQKASMIRSLIDCNVLIEVPAGTEAVKAGSKVSVILLNHDSAG
jgi:molybdopterin molybdotransferase